MPGYFVHIASAPTDIRSSELGLKGLIAPDLWKKSTPSKEEYLAFFNGCKGVPSYQQVLLLCSTNHGGTHFGSKPSDTNHADFSMIASLFHNGQLDADSIFFKGYVHHLLADKTFYADESICNITRFNADYAIDAKTAKDNLHLDWDKTNHAIATKYPEIVPAVSILPTKAKKVIAFVEGIPMYVALEPMLHFIQSMRQPKTLEQLLAE